MPTQTHVAAPLADKVQGVLERSHYLRPSEMTVEAGEGRVEIRGSVGSFFEKQMAQELVLRLDGVEQVDNHLKVSWS